MREKYENYQDRRTDECFKKIIAIMNECDKYRYRIGKKELEKIKVYLLTLYHDAFEQGVYVSRK